MNSEQAMEIIKRNTRKAEYTEDDIAEMIEALEYMRDIEYFTPEAWMFNLGDFYDRIGKYELALKYYHMAIDNGDTVSFIGIARTYHHMGLDVTARVWCLKAYDAGWKRQAADLLERLETKE